jgi:RimJ/RimL family protein N-acetyltransferase
MMIIPGTRLEGTRLSLRLVEPRDAAYIYGLRRDPAYNEHLSIVAGTVEDQRSWIASYKARQTAGAEYYFVIERKDRVRCGVVRLYNITIDRFTWGSWILDYNKPAKAALESAVLSFEFGFNTLGLNTANVDVRVNNTHAEAFYRRLGMVESCRTEQDIFLEYSKEQFDLNKSAYLTALQI